MLGNSSRKEMIIICSVDLNSLDCIQWLIRKAHNEAAFHGPSIITCHDCIQFALASNLKNQREQNP